MTREEILTKALDIVNGNRQQDYGSPEDTFENIALLWNAYTTLVTGDDIGLTAKDVAAMMILMKIARTTNGHGKDDNWIDIAGYAACGGEIESDARQI